MNTKRPDVCLESVAMESHLFPTCHIHVSPEFWRAGKVQSPGQPLADSKRSKQLGAQISRNINAQVVESLATGRYPGLDGGLVDPFPHWSRSVMMADNCFVTSNLSTPFGAILVASEEGYTWQLLRLYSWCRSPPVLFSTPLLWNLRMNALAPKMSPILYAF